MVAFKQIFDDEKLIFVAGRNFKYDGRLYTLGEVVPNDLVKNARNRESLIRSQRVVPVADDLNDMPRAYRAEVKNKAVWQAKFADIFESDSAEPADDFFADDHTIAQVQEYLNDNQTVADWGYALMDEVSGANRVTLVTWIVSGNDTVTDAAIEAYVTDEDNYLAAAPLENFDIADAQALYA